MSYLKVVWFEKTWNNKQNLRSLIWVNFSVWAFAFCMYVLQLITSIQWRAYYGWLEAPRCLYLQVSLCFWHPVLMWPACHGSQRWLALAYIQEADSEKNRGRVWLWSGVEMKSGKRANQQLQCSNFFFFFNKTQTFTALVQFYVSVNVYGMKHKCLFPPTPQVLLVCV